MSVERSHQFPVHLYFGTHGPESVGRLSAIKDKLTALLEETTEGKVVYFMEDTFFPEDSSRHVLKRTSQGILPLKAYLEARYFLKAKGSDSKKMVGVKMPSEDELEEIKNELFERDDIVSVFWLKEFEALDELATRFSGRILLQIEATPSERSTEIKKRSEKLKQHGEKVMAFIQIGEFDLALDFLQRWGNYQLLLSIERERRVATQIGESLEEKEVLAVIGRLGSAHTGVFHIIKRRGVEVTRDFDDEDERGYHYLKLDEILRRLMLSKNPQITQLDWYQALIGSALDGLLMTKVLKEGESVNGQELTRTINQLLKDRFSTLEKVRAFEKEVKEVGSFSEVVRGRQLLPI